MIEVYLIEVFLMSKSSKLKFSLIEFGVLVVIVALLVSILAPIYSALNRPSHVIRTETQLRGITQSLTNYANTNNSYYPGVSSMGDLFDARVEYRYWVLLDQNYFTGEYVISVTETKTGWTAGNVSNANYSYAMLKLDGEVGQRSDTGRRQEWRNTFNPDAVVVSDRNIGSDTQSNVQSLHVAEDEGWKGYVAWNDGRASFESTHLLDTLYGKAGTLQTDDNLFEAVGEDDAYMIYTGD